STRAGRICARSTLSRTSHSRTRTSRLSSRLAGPPPTVLVIGGIASVQFGSATAKTLFDDVGPAGTVMLRVVLAAIVLVVAWWRWAERPRRRTGAARRRVLGLLHPHRRARRPGLPRWGRPGAGDGLRGTADAAGRDRRRRLASAAA